MDKFSVDDFEWKKGTFKLDKGYILEVDVKYPKQLRGWVTQYFTVFT